MSLRFWFYVSRSRIADDDAGEVVQEIVQSAQVKNVNLEITGALVFSDGHFGQLIEGPPASILALRSSILLDVRHGKITTIGDGRAARRRFEGWSLAYSGTSMVTSRALQWALRDSAQRAPDAGQRLLQLLEEIAAGGA